MRFLAFAVVALLPACASPEPLPANILGSQDAGLSAAGGSIGANGGSTGTYTDTGGSPTASAGGDPGSSGGSFGDDPSASGGASEFGSGGSTDTSAGGSVASGGSTGFVFPPLPSSTPAPVTDGGACANAICFDVFDCVIFHPGNTCGFTKCDGFICKP